VYVKVILNHEKKREKDVDRVDIMDLMDKHGLAQTNTKKKRRKEDQDKRSGGDFERND